jgi:hypothetical protein
LFLSEIVERGYFSLCRTEDADLSKNSLVRWLLPGMALVAGILGISAVWVTAATILDRSCSWLALLAALDVALLLKVTNAPAGPVRIAVAVTATAVAVVLSQWLIVAAQIGISLGMGPLTASLRLGPVLAWHLSKLSLTDTDWILLLASLPLAAILAQSRAADHRAGRLEASQ